MMKYKYIIEALVFPFGTAMDGLAQAAKCVYLSLESCPIGLFGLSQTQLNGPSENSRVLCLETLAPGTATLFVEPNAKGNVRPLVQQLLGLSRWQQQSNKASVGLV